ncbi:hypothetical protein PVAND_011831 [Polypedilum vanderplanki]|uniref:Uncharacterized protein n=1 Tax=Polypedilum vanderplanki TaxID=319348 RepID=A0A9J6CKL8_POLVA|nr:hypothetical protein PVAND_011831 [Polypedilum vanderplanki]
MVKIGDLLKIVLLIQFFELFIAHPLTEDVYEYDQDFNGYVPIVTASNYWPQRYYPSSNRLYPTYPKRNAELINSLLSLPKNLDSAGK